MDSFKLLKRRTTDLFNSLPQSLPSIQSLHLGGTHHSHGYGHGPNHLTMKGTWEKISGLPPLPRSSHSLNVVGGTVYIFGGESEDARKPVSNDMHAVTLPSSGAQADCYAIKAKAALGSKKPQPIPTVQIEGEPDPASSGLLDKGKAPATDAELEAPELGDVPAPRVGHATAVIGHRIFLSGGRGGPDMSALDEHGRVWVFDTRTNVWSYLDPSTPAAPTPQPGASAIPAPRSFHVAAATDKPRNFNAATAHHPKPSTRAEAWRDWALGDSEEVGIPQRPIVGNVAANATDADAEGYGTFIIHGGCLSGTPERASDVWAFDIHSHTWQRLPDAPGAPRGGAALAIAHSRLYRFGGFNGTGEEGGQLDVLELGVDSFDDEFSAGEVSIAARGGWQSLLQTPREDVGYKEEDPTAAPLTEDETDPWPAPRSVAGFQAVSVGGGGRDYLVLMLGEREPSGAGHESAGGFWDDVWAFQVPAHHGGVAAGGLANSVLSAVGRKSAEGRWARVEVGPYDDEDDESAEGPGARGWFASATMEDVGEGIVLWGGLDGGNRRLGDGWILRLG
ncbi:hypothetical protein B0T25DRAFT_121609 [Lasiosphaeria hispida]|uniref:Nitrile-specifier protein 5 n=1 Tax=Lasiosphaeria hispida TaxID=260671 RepID=A0AAJ0HRK2_9PEZI|nr:hypothetical protein B0T25DRAFT_121609 [Lasiosphaeria hispida]